MASPGSAMVVGGFARCRLSHRFSKRQIAEVLPKSNRELHLHYYLELRRGLCELLECLLNALRGMKRDELLFVSPMPAFASRLPFACR